MGEVYRARDASLKRGVAIKVLPKSLPGDSERLARLQHETEVLASLNHPNVTRIYGLERISATTALVMERVEGRHWPSTPRTWRKILPRAIESLSAPKTRRPCGSGMFPPA